MIRFDNDGILEANGASLPVCQTTIVQDLKKHVHNIWVSFFHFIEKDERIWIVANFFS
ncbi:Uncharacterised protein [Streptococcus pneumoniae]|nr:Uncharacterised protein [Streptococcus pneumoniae]